MFLWNIFNVGNVKSRINKAENADIYTVVSSLYITLSLSGTIALRYLAVEEHHKEKRRYIMEREKEALLKAFEKNKPMLKDLLALRIQRMYKSADASEAFRKEGTVLFTQRKHDVDVHKEIFLNYCRSVSTALSDAQLSLTYMQRSSFLLHLQKYEDCIKDCNKVMELTNSNVFRNKMLIRKAACLKKLESSEFQNALNDLEQFRDQVEHDETKNLFTGMIYKLYNLELDSKDNAEKKNDVIKLDEILDGIQIKHDEKYGRHLVATKDYKPGDIIMVENLFAATVKMKKSSTHCHYCLKICWSGIPCQHCGWAIFCSEDCRDKAWELYHDVECSLVPFIKVEEEVLEFNDTCIRAVLTGIRQAGSISQLEADLNSIDCNTADGYSKGFLKDGKYTENRIESVYVLDNASVPDSELEAMGTYALSVVIGFARFSQLLKNINLENIEELIKNKDVIFLGSLFIKIMSVKSLNDSSIFPTHLYACEEFGGDYTKCKLDSSCCVRGSCFTPITSLVSHRCFPNAGRCFSEDRKVILYALLPIKKDSQIFMSYYCEFDEYPLAERLQMLKNYNIVCDCIACIEDWPPIINLSEEELEEGGYAIGSFSKKKSYQRCLKIFDAIRNGITTYSKEDIETLSKTMVKATKMKQPNQLTCYLIESLRQVMSHMYGLKLDRPDFVVCKLI